jgi:hypothetical protein
VQGAALGAMVGAFSTRTDALKSMVSAVFSKRKRKQSALRGPSAVALCAELITVATVSPVVILIDNVQDRECGRTQKGKNYWVKNWSTVYLKSIPIDASRALRSLACAENAPIQTRKIARAVKVANCFNAKPEVVVLQPKNQNALEVV